MAIIIFIFQKKINASIAYTDPKADHIIQNKIGDSLAAQGFNEILTNSLTSPQPLQHT